MSGDGKIEEALTFDDVLLVPSYSEILPNDADVSTKLTPKITLNIPLVSAAMDTVTESSTAIAMAQEGGIGVIHRNMSPERQAAEVEKVKKFESGMIVNPLTVRAGQLIKEALDIMVRYNITGLPVTDEGGTLHGIITNRDLRLERNLDYEIRQVMTPREKLITMREGKTLDSAKELLHKHKIEKLPVVDSDFKLCGLITMKDIEKIQRYPTASKDELGRLRCGAAVGVGQDREERVEKLIAVGCDVIVVDTAHAHSSRVVESIKDIRKSYKDTEIIAGNIATSDAAEMLIGAGADAIKVGVGPGSICTTRVIAGIGVPQVTAIKEVFDVSEKKNVPIIADGGIKYSGDITKALASGACCVMIGNLFAGTNEAPGETVLFQGRSYKVYRGMGSIEAMRQGSRDRYAQDEVLESKLVPEGIEGRVPYKGPLGGIVYQLVGGLKSGMGYTGCKDLRSLRSNARFIKVTNAGLREGHVHDVIITKEAPNYRIE